MPTRRRLPIILVPVIVATLTVIALLGTLRPFIHAAPLDPPAPPNPSGVFTHLNQEKRLHWVTTAISMSAGTFVAPDGDWSGGIGVVNAPTNTITQAYALHAQAVAIYRTSVQDNQGHDVAWETADFLQLLAADWNNGLPTTLLTDTQISPAGLDGVDILVLPDFSHTFADEVTAALGPDGLAALADFVTGGGTLYAQGQSMYLLEAAGLLPPGTVDLDTPLQLPPNANNQGLLEVHNPLHPLSFNWATNELWLLDDPTLTITAPLTAVASYTNTLGGPHTAVAYGRFGQGQLILVSGHPVSGLHSDQQTLFFNALLMGMAERGELYGRAIQTYDGNVAPNIIPAYEEGLPISVTLHFDHLWQGITLTNALVEERVQPGFIVPTDTISPPPTSVVISATNGVTETIITWGLGDGAFGSTPFHYIALTERDALAPGTVTFSTGAATYTDAGTDVTWAHPDFTLSALLSARLEGEHDNEPDRYFTIPAEGLYTDEFIYLENKENTLASNVQATRYIPLIVPIIGLEEQREPLATNAGETVWMKNELFIYDDPRYITPTGMTAYTATWGLDQWDGTTYVTMTTPGGYHADPILPRAPGPGFFVTIPPAYSDVIQVTNDFKLLLPALRVEWDLGDWPGYWYEMPAVRYGIHTTELFSRPVSFTGDPFVGTVVVDATGGSIYTGSGRDPLIYRDYLAEVEVHPPTPPTETGITYQDIWSRTHELPIRANFIDVFNFASCACGPGGLGERHAMLNVTFGIWADMDGDGTGDTLLTDFDAMKGVMPTRLTGDLEIIVKSRNLGTAIGADENVIDGRIFRGLGFNITPRNGSWADSYDSLHSTLVSDTIEGGYYDLLFQQEIPVNATDLITIHARLDPTLRPIEGMMKLHDGVRFVYRQQFAGSGQYEVNDTHIQGIVGVRSDAELTSRVLPVAVSTYGDELFTLYEMDDLYDGRSFTEDPYLQSWGYGNLAATTYVGGRDRTELLHSLVSLGDRTWLRVEINNNSGLPLTNVSLTPLAPAGITAVPVFTDPATLPVPMWPDLPFLHLTEIPDVAYGIYYFELQVDAAATDLQGQVLHIPFAFSAGNAPANFEIPPATLAVRSADGRAPTHVYGTSDSIVLHDTLEPAIELLGLRLLTDDQAETLRQLVISDTSVIPNTGYAADYFTSLTTTLPYTLVNRQLTVNEPVESLPWLAEVGQSGVHVVAHQTISTTRAVRQPINRATGMNSVDDFGLTWADNADRLYVEARGASMHTTYVTGTITRTLTGEVVDFLYAGEQHEVELILTASNRGNDVATSTLLTITLGANFTPTMYATGVITPISGGLLWDVGDMGPYTNRSQSVVFDVLANPALRTPHDEVTTAVTHTDAQFINAYSGREVTTRSGDDLTIPFGWRELNATFQLLADLDGDGVGETDVTSFANAPGYLPSRLSADLTLTIKTRTGGGANSNEIIVPLFLGDGYSLSPRNGSWANSFTASHSSLTAVDTINNYAQLAFNQTVPQNGGDTITIRAIVDGTAVPTEGLFTLTDGVHFDRQPTLSPGLGLIGQRSDVVMSSWISPTILGTYSDTLFIAHEISDAYDPRLYADAPYLMSYGLGNAAATVYLGESSLLALGETAVLRVELANNSGAAWTAVTVTPQPPAGFTVTPLSAADLPAAPWPDLPALNRQSIPDAATGVYYFTVQANDPALRGNVWEWPIEVSVNDAPLAVPPVVVAVRQPDGSAPFYALGASRYLHISETWDTAVTPLAMRLLTAAEMAQLQNLLAADTAAYPHTSQAETYFNSRPLPITYSYANGQLNYTLPADLLLDDLATPRYAVSLNEFAGTTATSYDVSAGATLTSTDDFDVVWATTGDALAVSSAGPSLPITITVTAITRTLTGEPADLLYAGETSRVTLRFELANEGSLAANDTAVTLHLNDEFTPTDYPANVTATADGLAWQVGDLSVDASADVLVTLEVYVDPTTQPQTMAQPQAVTAEVWGYITAVTSTTATFTNPLDGHARTAALGDAFNLPYGHDYPRTLNASFVIYVDLDGDGVKETAVTDLAQLRGMMPTRLVGDLDILIKTQTIGIAQNNVLELPLLTDWITPRNGTWANSYVSAYSVLSDTITMGNYEYLVFQQGTIPLGEFDTVQLFATLDATVVPTEGPLTLLQDVHLYVNGYNGPAATLSDATYGAGIIGVRSDAAIDSAILPGAASTYSDTVFIAHALDDPTEPQPFPGGVYRQTWGFGDVAASSIMGASGTDSLIALGETTQLQVILRNNSGQPWTEITVWPEAPAGITVTQLYTATPPDPAWPDLPFLNVGSIPDASYGVYYFELSVDAAAVQLQGQVWEIPVTLQIQGASADFAAPPAYLGIYADDGSTPQHTLGTSTALQVTSGLDETLSPLAMRQLTAGQMTYLQQLVDEDTAVTPNTSAAITYFLSLTSTLPFTVDNHTLTYTLPTILPIGEPVYAVGLHQVTAVTPGLYTASDGATLRSRDDFGQLWTAVAPANDLTVSGATLQLDYTITAITRTLTGEALDVLYTNEENLVRVRLELANEGNDGAESIQIDVPLLAMMELATYPAAITPTTTGFTWEVAALDAGETTTVELLFRANLPYTTEHDGLLPLFDAAAADFFHVHAGQRMSATVGDLFAYPFVRIDRVYMPVVINNYVSVQAADLVVTAVSVNQGQLSVTIQNQGNAPVTTGEGFWVDLYVNPQPAPTAVNQIWHDGRSSYGAAWAVTANILPGASLTLTINDAYYAADRSHLPPSWTATMLLYAQVDSYNPGSSYGAIQELHELLGEPYNNITGPVMTP